MKVGKGLPQIGNAYVRWVGRLIGVLLLIHWIAALVAEGLWFQEVDYFQVFTTRLLTQSGLGLMIFGMSVSLLWGNLKLAQRYAWLKPPSGSDRLILPGRMGLLWLLPLILLLSLTISIVLLYHGQIAASHWQPTFSLYTVSTPIPIRFRPQVIWQLIQTWGTQLWQPALVGGVAVALLIYPQILLRVSALVISLSFGIILSEHWTQVLLSLNPTSFNQLDPLFQRDISFYIFTLPLWELFEFWLIGLSALMFLSVSLSYLLSGGSLSQGYFPGFSASQQRHLYSLGGFVMLTVALNYWLDRFNLLYSPEGIAYGASYTSVTTELPAYNALSLLAFLIALYLICRTLFWDIERGTGGTQETKKTQQKEPPIPSSPIPSLRLIGLYTLAAILAGWALPLAVQRLIVQPNELQLEQPYIQHAIALTREAFNLSRIDVETFDPLNNLTYEDLQRNDLTIDNVRLWDKRPLLETNRQLQRIRLYYEFPDADIDRYTLSQAGNTTQQQVLIAARELDYSDVPSVAQTWINQHLIYTHGYGFTISPVNIAGEGGVPDYLVEGIEPIAASSLVGDSIPIGKPRIYYGEITDTYIMTQTRVKELDYPSGSDNVYNIYEGRGGVHIGTFWQRLLFANHLGDWRMLLTDDFTPQTKLLFRRTINSRVRAIAPFLRFDSDPYLVVANTGDKTWERGYMRDETQSTASSQPDDSYLYWMMDAYTISDRFPYSDPTTNDFNYIRNSVKVVVDAYHGSVNFYVADESDPIIRTWERFFPGMFQPLSRMPETLRSHIRYPQDLYRVQSEQLMTYHMTDPVVFYNREDQWRAPNEIYGDQPQLVKPYYLIMKLPTDSNEEFVLLRPFTPIERTNLVAWLAARSDGTQYGRMLLYIFPKQKFIYGPEQLEARINQDPVISQQISLWNRRGSRAIQGNLLVIPIDQSLLYIEPLYLEAEQNRLPILARVIVVYGNRIAMAETLESALTAIFQPAPADTPIIRSVEEDVLPE
ncbi:MAG: COG1615 family transporter [Cyanobacteria bacterium CRU_2_1]|nr:COG1615 family transporter [Cyanobacteria bacterium RU_5_0]NJR60309.1 COG1615 family transporter [Cyanobacteria bacterium CRU_2_1]